MSARTMKPVRTGWCNQDIPLGHTSHRRCLPERETETALLVCPCQCHDSPAPAAHQPPAPTPLDHLDVTPGLYDDVPETDYHADRGSLSHSGAKTILKAPALFRHEQQHPVFKNVFDFGSAAHARVLGVGQEVRVIPDEILASNGATSTKDAKAFIAQARADGAVPLKGTDAAIVEQMADRLAEHALAMELLSEGRPEVSAYAPDPVTGVMLRCRFDWLGPSIATDYKSAASADPQWFARKAADFGYHQQHAWYFDLAAAAGHPLDAFCFIVQMKEPPYLVTVVELVDRAVDRGRARNRQAIDIYAECLKTGIWEGYVPDDEYSRVDLPAWAYADDTPYLDDDMEISA